MKAKKIIKIHFVTHVKILVLYFSSINEQKIVNLLIGKSA
jgi:hypothetical protein